MASAELIAGARERLTYDCPFWAGGVTRGPDGEWRRPAPSGFQGCAKVVDKRRQLVPLIGHDWQLEFDAALELQRAAGQPMRAIVLKARQLGISTWVQAKMLQRLTQLSYQAAMVCAHEVKAAGRIFNMARLMYAHLPSEEELGLGFSIKPDLTGASFSPNGRKFMSFGERSRQLRSAGRTEESILDIDTANAPEAGRGGTINLAHLSEVAKWPDRATSGTASKMISILNSVPYEPETLVVLESTPNGLNHFYRRWVAAESGQEDPDTGETYVTIFLPWWRDAAYSIMFSTVGQRDRFVEGVGDTRRHGEVAEDEPMLVEAYGCSPEQLLWRRMQIRTQHEGSVQLFKQENAANPQEAFISSGRPYFSGILVSRAVKAAEAAPEPVRGSLVGTEWRARRTRSGVVQVPQRALWVPEGEARRGAPWNLVPGGARDVVQDAPLLDVWEQPVTREALEQLPAKDRPPVGAYVAAADIAEGEADTFTQETDYHAVSVWDHRSRMQVARYVSRIDRHLLPLWLYLIGLYYNRALLVVEVNSVGMAIQDPLKSDLKYSPLYKRRRYDAARDATVVRYGWKTDAQSKPIAEDAFGAALQSDTHGGLRSVSAARQLTVYVKDERGRRGALPGEHDDELMSAMIAARVMEEHRPPRDGARKGRVRGFEVEDPTTGY